MWLNCVTSGVMRWAFDSQKHCLVRTKAQVLIVQWEMESKAFDLYFSR